MSNDVYAGIGRVLVTLLLLAFWLCVAAVMAIGSGVLSKGILGFLSLLLTYTAPLVGTVTTLYLVHQGGEG